MSKLAQQRDNNTSFKTGNREIKLLLLSYNMIVYIETKKLCIDILLELFENFKNLLGVKTVIYNEKSQF